MLLPLRCIRWWADTFAPSVAKANGVLENAGKARWALIGFGELMGIVSQVMNWNTVPHWYGIGLLILFPIGVWWGVSLRMRGKPAVAA